MLPFALGLITEPLRRWLQPALLVALVALSAWCFWTHHRLSSERAAHVATRIGFDQREAKAQADARAREVALRADRDAAVLHLEDARHEIARHRDHNAALAAEVDRLRTRAADADRRLRDHLAAYAAGGAADTAAACQARAAALGAYAADVSRAADEIAESAAELAAVAVAAAGERDAYAAEVVACVKAWPR
jgi:hypothetical protein